MTATPIDPFAHPNHNISRRQQRNFNEIVLAVIVAIVMIGIGRWLFLTELPRIMGEDEISFFGNLFSEGFGIIITVIIVDRLNQRRADNALRDELVSQVGSQSNDFAIDGLRRLKEKGWLSDEDNLLRGKAIRSAKWQGADLEKIDLSKADLGGANLTEANLLYANLSQAILWSANLSEADLEGGNLSQAILWFANLSEADLEGTNMNGADLPDANLNKADLWGANLNKANLECANLTETNLEDANLNKANLWGANLTEADLDGANLSAANLRHANLQDAIIDEITRFDETTRLPDGTYWTPGTDMSRFTDPNHPNFWRSTHSNSPANPNSEWWKRRLAENK